jgi:CBS domain-containing protein
VRARDVMTTPVIVLRPDTPAREAAALLCAHGFTSAPVVDAGRRLVGMATEADLVRGRIPPDGWVVDEDPDPAVDEVMTPAPAAMGPEDDLADVVALMLDSGATAVPIVADGRPVGIVSRRDVLRAVARHELTSDDVRRRRGLGPEVPAAQDDRPSWARPPAARPRRGGPTTGGRAGEDTG